MRWCRRGTHIATFGLLVVVFLLWAKPFWPIYTPRGTTHNQPNVTVFFDNLHQMHVEPRNVLKTCQEEIDVLVIVPSSVANQVARKAVRNVWREKLPSSWPVMFYLGATTDHVLQSKVAREGEDFGDIAQDYSFLDSYNNLTLKTLSLISWAQKFCKKANYVLKIDDDVYLNIPKFVKFLECLTTARKDIYKTLYQGNNVDEKTGPSSNPNSCSLLKPYDYLNYYVNSQNHNYESYIFGGYMYKEVKADRNPNSKWYLDPTVYKYDKLPPFLSGTAYILSSNLIPHLLHEAKNHPIITLEDVYLSGIIGSQGLKLKLSHLDGWSRFRPRWDSVCTYNELLTAHGLSPDELSTMTHGVTALDNDSCNGFLTYILNNINYFISYLLPRVPK